MFGDIGKMLKMAGQMKAKLPEMKTKLAAAEFGADAGGGVVSATVNGKMQLVDIKIAPEVLGDGDAGMLADLIKAAVSAAQEKAAVAAAEAMAELTGGMKLPGMEELM
ncbi:MAG: YbaB/EbfC family nucleoid-associated protein [Planctomycetota bacterium]|nr:YbaB/EbfC family nucleoid-associated protein [Planctomycetota bacterium]